MCHLIFFLPLLALPALWLLPAEAGIAITGIILILSAGMYVLIIKAMRAPLSSGAQCVLHELGTVRAVDRGALSVWVRSELWSAETDDAMIKEGDAVEVIGIKGIVLKVRRAKTAAGSTAPQCEGARVGSRRRSRRQSGRERKPYVTQCGKELIMDWLSEYWIPIFVVVVLAFLMTRRGGHVSRHGGCCGGAFRSSDSQRESPRTTERHQH